MTPEQLEALKREVRTYFNTFAPEYENLLHRHGDAVIDHLAATGRLAWPMEEHDEGCPHHGTVHVCNGFLYTNRPKTILQSHARALEWFKKLTQSYRDFIEAGGGSEPVHRLILLQELSCMNTIETALSSDTPQKLKAQIHDLTSALIEANKSKDEAINLLMQSRTWCANSEITSLIEDYLERERDDKTP